MSDFERAAEPFRGFLDQRAAEEKAIVERLGAAMGFGRIMQLCEQIWRTKQPGGEHTVGPCGTFMVPCPHPNNNRGAVGCDICFGAGRITKGVAALLEIRTGARVTPEAPKPARDMPPVIKFLLGEGELDGRWFGDGSAPVVNGIQHRFWWRTALREAWNTRSTEIPHRVVEKARERLEQIEIEMNAIGRASPAAISEIRLVLDLLPKGEKR